MKRMRPAFFAVLLLLSACSAKKPAVPSSFTGHFKAEIRNCSRGISQENALNVYSGTFRVSSEDASLDIFIQDPFGAPFAELNIEDKRVESSGPFALSRQLKKIALSWPDIFFSENIRFEFGRAYLLRGEPVMVGGISLPGYLEAETGAMTVRVSIEYAD